jgi:MoaA/NifB/PqqE/SkfB family radical SAM enzyme
MQLPIYKVQPNDKIRRLELELTSTCNLKCPLCVREIMDLPEKNQYRPLEEIIAQLDSYPNLEYVTIAGAIAEPTSYPNLIELIIYLRKRDVEISLFINGDTRNDAYYRKLGVIFHGCRGNVYFSMCGSTQELHEKYRVNSNLKRVLRRLDIVNRYSNNKGILTWLVFNYNEQDFHDNYQEYKKKYKTEFFYTLPVAEHFKMESTIRLPEKLHKVYMEQIDRTDFSNIVCPANTYEFVQITYDGKVVPCSLYRLYGEKHCFECSTKNKAVLKANMIKNIAEAESDTSEAPLRLYYDRNNEKR